MKAGCTPWSPTRSSIASPPTACASACITLEGESIVPCAVWAGDDLVVTRIRADFAGVDAVTIVTRQASGDEIGRISDVAVRPGQREILSAFSAAHLRALPATRVHVSVTAPMAAVANGPSPSSPSSTAGRSTGRPACSDIPDHHALVHRRQRGRRSVSGAARVSRTGRAEHPGGAPDRRGCAAAAAAPEDQQDERGGADAPRRGHHPVQVRHHRGSGDGGGRRRAGRAARVSAGRAQRGAVRPSRAGVSSDTVRRDRGRHGDGGCAVRGRRRRRASRWTCSSTSTAACTGAASRRAPGRWSCIDGCRRGPGCAPPACTCTTGT